jgi:hypothetical protein
MARVAPDANDILVYPLNEKGPNRPNLGTLGSIGDLVDYGNMLTEVPGIIKIDEDFKGVYIPGQSISPNHDGTGGAYGVTVPTNFSISAWVYVRRYASNFGSVFTKQYIANSWAFPFLTCGLYIRNTSDGRWIAYVTTSGTLRELAINSPNLIPQGRWVHIGETWDGTTLRAYLNGTLVGTLVPGGGAVDNSSNPGKWFIGTIPDTTSLDGGNIMVQDVRLANIVRPQSYFADVYFGGTVP